MDTTPSQLDYPLNLFARALELDEGEVHYLHFGMFQHPQQSVAEAQQHASDQLLALLPPAPARVLEVGIGLGTTAAILESRQYCYTGITPDRRQIALCTRPGRQLHCTRFQDFAGEPASFDSILFQESAQYMWPEELLSKARQLTTDEGSVVIGDEMPAATLNNMSMLSWRHGFGIDTQHDVSEQVMPAYQHLIACLQRFRARLAEDLGLDPVLIEGMTRYLQARLHKYRHGDYRYVMLRLRRLPAAQTIREQV